MSGGFDPAKSAFSRVFLHKGGAGPEVDPSYESCMKAGGLARTVGGVTRIECPDPQRRGKFKVIGQIQAAEENATLTLTGRFAANLASTMVDLAAHRCPMDLQIHFGKCKLASIFNEFTKALVLEDAYPTNYSTDDLGALSSDENSVVNEMLDVSAGVFYELLPMAFSEEAADIITNELVDGVICGPSTCGDCGAPDDGCYHGYWITLAAGGSPGTPPDLIHTANKDVDWYADDIDTLGAAENATAVACLGDYIVVVSNDSNSLHWAYKVDVDTVGVDPVWTENAVGFVAGGAPRNIWSVGNYAFIVGDNGYVYGLSDPTVGVTVLDAGVAAAGDALWGVHALDDQFAVAVGSNGVVIMTENGEDWTAVNHVTGVGIALNAVWCKTEEEWWVVTDNGHMYYTLDGGAHWAEKLFTGSGAGVCYDIQFPTKSEGFLSHADATPHGYILRSYDGGYSWQRIPEATGIFIPANDRLTAIATCPDDPNYMQAGGLGDNGADGILLVGAD